jgi:hypothetical protein
MAMDYYIEIVETSSELHQRFWSVEGNVAHRDLAPSEIGTHKAEPNEDVLATIQRRFPAAQFHKLVLGPGEYFARMARPGRVLPEHSPGYYPDKSAPAMNTRTVSTAQLHALIQEFQQICRVVQPAKANFNTYGIEIRNFLIIACTEVETQWKNILNANGVNGQTRHDYVKLSSAMKLPEYRVAVPWYPWLEPISPFENWKPTAANVKQDLPWYDAYNATKHDRENAFDKSTLENALQAITACFVMLCAQYGWDFARRKESSGDAFFHLIESPKWGPGDIYFGGQPTRQRQFPF